MLSTRHALASESVYEVDGTNPGIAVHEGDAVGDETTNNTSHSGSGVEVGNTKS